MSATTLEKAIDSDTWLFLDEPPQEERAFDAPDAGVHRLSEDWIIDDPVDELIHVLSDTGREDEARLIANLLDHPTEAEMHRLLLQQMEDVLAEDWDSPEDAAYDEL